MRLRTFERSFKLSWELLHHMWLRTFLSLFIFSWVNVYSRIHLYLVHYFTWTHPPDSTIYGLLLRTARHDHFIFLEVVWTFVRAHSSRGGRRSATYTAAHRNTLQHTAVKSENRLSHLSCDVFVELRIICVKRLVHVHLCVCVCVCVCVMPTLSIWVRAAREGANRNRARNGGCN